MYIDDLFTCLLAYGARCRCPLGAVARTVVAVVRAATAISVRARFRRSVTQLHEHVARLGRIFDAVLTLPRLAASSYLTVVVAAVRSVLGLCEHTADAVLLFTVAHTQYYERLPGRRHCL